MGGIGLRPAGRGGRSVNEALKVAFSDAKNAWEFDANSWAWWCRFVGGLEAETASVSCPFSESENGGSNHDQTTAQGARNRMGGIQRTQLEPRTFDIDPQRMFRDRQGIGDLRAVIPQSEHGHRVHFTR